MKIIYWSGDLEQTLGGIVYRKKAIYESVLNKIFMYGLKYNYFIKQYFQKKLSQLPNEINKNVFLSIPFQHV